MPRSTRGRAQYRAPRRTILWDEISSGTNKISVGASSLVLLAQMNASELAQRPLTVTRVRGRILVRSDQVVADEEPQCVFGMMVVSDTASALGATAIPNPVSNPDGNWFMYEDCPCGFVNDVDGNYTWNVYEFDSKGQRKVSADEDVVLVVGNRSAADGAQLIVSGRILYKLH